MTTTTPDPQWPTQRGVRSGIVTQFGETRAQLLEFALITGDPLADAVVAEIHEGGREVRIALNKGIRGGLASVTNPPSAVAALLTRSESAPSYVDDALLDTAPLPYFSSPPPVHAVSLSAGALVRVYDSPSIAKVLATTGKLVEAAARRIEETGKWLNQAMLPGALRVGENGYVATMQVRMLHAHMRRLARTRGYDEAAYGAPINQVDLARTWMDFTVTSYRAEEAIGFSLLPSELTSLYRYWWHVAHLLGIDLRLVEGISTNEEAARVDELLQAVTGRPIPESAELALRTLESVASKLHEILPLPPGMALQALFALTRRFHGHNLCDELQLPRASAADAVLDPAISVIQRRRAHLRTNKQAWQQEQEKGIGATKDILAQGGQPTAYQHQAEPTTVPG